MYHKTPATLNKLAVELIASVVCNHHTIAPWIYTGVDLIAPDCNMTLAAALAAHVPINFTNIAVDILQGLDILHTHGIMHCNLTLDHVMLRKVGLEWRASICGLGNVQFNTGKNHNFAYLLPYRPPEIDNDGTARECHFTPMADIYAAGIILYKMRYPGRDAFGGDIANQHQCSVEYYENTINGTSGCLHGRTWSRPCTRAPNTNMFDTFMALGLTTDAYDCAVLAMIKPAPTDRPSAGQLLRYFTAGGGLGVRPEAAPVVHFDAAKVVEYAKNFGGEDIGQFIYACLTNGGGRVCCISTDFKARLQDNISSIAFGLAANWANLV